MVLYEILLWSNRLISTIIWKVRLLWIKNLIRTYKKLKRFLSDLLVLIDRHTHILLILRPLGAPVGRGGRLKVDPLLLILKKVKSNYFFQGNGLFFSLFCGWMWRSISVQRLTRSYDILLLFNKNSNRWELYLLELVVPNLIFQLSIQEFLHIWTGSEKLLEGRQRN